MHHLETKIKHVEEMLKELLERTPLPDTLNAEQCGKYLDVTSLKTISNYVCNGTIPKHAVVELCNGEKKFIKSKLTKASLVAPVEVKTTDTNNQLSLF